MSASSPAVASFGGEVQCDHVVASVAHERCDAVPVPGRATGAGQKEIGAHASDDRTSARNHRAELSAVPGDSAGSPEVAVEPGEAPGPHGLADWPGFVPPTYRRLARIRLRFEHERTASRHIGSHLLPTRGPSWRRHRIVAEPAAHPRLLLPRRTEQFPSEFVACHWESGCRARRGLRPFAAVNSPWLRFPG
jgi:hypothetical protein